eukprot:359027-Chlamydomonas_euryale.AAC.1
MVQNQRTAPGDSNAEMRRETSYNIARIGRTAAQRSTRLYLDVAVWDALGCVGTHQDSRKRT